MKAAFRATVILLLLLVSVIAASTAWNSGTLGPGGPVRASTTTDEFIPVSKTDSGYADVNGTRLYYEVAGSGDVVVLIHGSFGDRRYWDGQFEEFARKYKVMRYDLRSHGRSALPEPGQPYSDAEDLNALMNVLGIKKAHILGLSLGSIIAVDFVLSRPEKCSSLIVIGPRVAGDSKEYRTADLDSLSSSISRAVRIVKTKGVKEGTDTLWMGNNPLSKTVRSAKTRAALLKMGYEYSWHRYLFANNRQLAFPMAVNKLNELSLPVLVMTAEYDLGVCKYVAGLMAEKIPGARLVNIPGAGHIMNMDKPGRFNRMVFKFIRSLKSGRPEF